MSESLEQQVEREHFKGPRDASDELGMEIVRQLVKQGVYESIVTSAIMFGLNDWGHRELNQLSDEQRGIVVRVIDAAALRYAIAVRAGEAPATPIAVEPFIRAIDEASGEQTKRIKGLIKLGDKEKGGHHGL